jgi:hypothetical protein
MPTGTPRIVVPIPAAVVVGLAVSAGTYGLVPGFGWVPPAISSLACGVLAGLVAWSRLPAPAVLAATVLCYGFHSDHVRLFGAALACVLSLSSSTRRRSRMFDGPVRVAAIAAGWLGACAVLRAMSPAPTTEGHPTIALAVLVTSIVVLFGWTLTANFALAKWMSRIRSGEVPAWSIARAERAERQPPRLVAESFGVVETASTCLCWTAPRDVAPTYRTAPVESDRACVRIHQDSGWLPAVLLEVFAGAARATVAVVFAAFLTFAIGIKGETSDPSHGTRAGTAIPSGP